jgi:hypothetical protein
VLVHVILFTPRADLSLDDRDRLVAALDRASSAIPSVRRVRVGRRITIGRPYEQLAPAGYEYLAAIEFDDREGLLAYLDHPAHAELATRFFASFEKAQIYDFELTESPDDLAALR